MDMSMHKQIIWFDYFGVLLLKFQNYIIEAVMIIVVWKLRALHEFSFVTKTSWVGRRGMPEGVLCN